MEFTALQDTFLKETTAQASSLKPEQKVPLKKGAKYQVHSHCAVDDAGKHVKIAFKGVAFGPQAKNTWYAFADHIEIDGLEPDNNPRDNEKPLVIATPANVKDFNIPLIGDISLRDPICGPGAHFTWGEALKNGLRKPQDKKVVEGIIRMAHQLEEVRQIFGNKPIRVNSWYRDPRSNKAAGGASQSRHLVGDAIDFVVEGIVPKLVHAELEKRWGSRGGLASSSVFTHIDLRGYKARWKYKF